MIKLKFDDNQEALDIETNLMGSLQNRLRNIYNLGYKEGYEEGCKQVFQDMRTFVEMDREGSEEE